MRALIVLLFTLSGSVMGLAQIDRCECLHIYIAPVVKGEPAEASIRNAYWETPDARALWKVEGGTIVTGNGTSSITFKTVDQVEANVSVTAEVTGPDGCKVVLKESAPISAGEPGFSDGWSISTWKALVNVAVDQLNRAEDTSVPIVFEISFDRGTARKKKVAIMKTLLRAFRFRKVDTRRFRLYFLPDGKEGFKTWRIMPADRPECRRANESQLIRVDALRRKLPTLFR